MRVGRPATGTSTPLRVSHMVRLVVSMPAVLKRVREMSKTKDQRIADTAPRAMRQQMREETEKARATL